MVNKPKQRGTAAETAFLRFARVNGFPEAVRNPLAGNKDQGDLTLCPKVIVEVKADKALDYPRFMRETEAERVNAGAAVGICAIKPVGLGDKSIANWWVLMASGTYEALEYLAGSGNFMASFLDASEAVRPLKGRVKFNPGKVLSEQAGYLSMMPGTRLKPGARRVSRTGWDFRFLRASDGLELLRYAGFGEPMPGAVVPMGRGYNADQVLTDHNVNWSNS